MSEERLTSLRNWWFTTSVGITAAIALVGFLVGFLWLPLAQPGERFRGVWDAICSAAGLLHNPSTREEIVSADYPTTRVKVVPGMLDGASAVSIGRGATLALRCTMCHGARGLSDANSPNLAGQYSIAIYKQLVDFKTGVRISAVMAPLVADLSDADMRDLAAYYAYLPRLTDSSVNQLFAHRRQRQGPLAWELRLRRMPWRSGRQGWRGLVSKAKPVAYLRCSA